jgi:LPS-assembly protein
MGSTNIIENSTVINFNEENFFTFNTRRNRKINFTEYYDLIYEYKNDCLVAGIKYKKSYYQDRDVKPKEDLLFTITFFPLTQYEQKIDENIYRN